MGKEQQRLALAGTGSRFSWAQLFNPISSILGGGDRYPEFMAKMFPKNPDAAWLTSKAAAVSLLAAALAGGARAIRHGLQMNDLAESDAPYKNMRTGISTTFNSPLGTEEDDIRKKQGVKKNAADEAAVAPLQTVTYPDATALRRNTLNLALPVLISALVAGGTYKKVDDISDKLRSNALDTAIKNKRRTVRNLMQARARQARGTITDKEVEKALADAYADDNYIKTAASKDPHPYTRGVLSSLGLIITALGGASAIGAYKYFSLSNPSNIKYKAIEKGLKEYAKQKALHTPLTIAPTDSQEYFSQIAGEPQESKPSPRQEPELVETHKPIGITL